MADEARRWWGDRVLDVGETLRWVLGPSTVWVSRRRAEWVLFHELADDPLADALEIGAACEVDEPGDRGAIPLRFAGAETGAEGLRLQPRLADRSVVSRPEDAFSVLPGEEVTVYVGSPIWLSLELLPGPQRMAELPLLRASDTWFGASTRDGELCFASRTRCRLRLEDVRWTPHRAVTAVTIRNPAGSPLPIERIYVPVPVLSLWAHESGMLRTASVVYTREDDDAELARFHVVEEGLPAATQLASPRREPGRGLVRAFAQLL